MPIMSGKAVDLTFFAKDDADKHKLSKEESEVSTVHDDRKPWASRMLWDISKAIIEVKTGTKQGAPFEGSNSEESRKARGQLTEYVSEILLRQHRVSTFAVTIYQRTAYLDRKSVV